MKKALITGIRGQDGSYLSELLDKKEYEVVGTSRENINLSSLDEVKKLIKKERPDEFYHLAGHSSVGTSFKDEFDIMNSNVNGTHHILASILEFAPECRFFFAASAEMFGHSKETPQNERTHHHPASPYGISKTTSFNLTRYYREIHGIHASSGILFNHESPRRGENFVTRKITMSVAKIKLGMLDFMELGNIEGRRDWGYAPEYVEAMWKMLQTNKADDYVLATGEAHTVREFVRNAFMAAQIEIEWHGQRGTVDEYATIKGTSQIIVKINPEFFRPTDIKILMGDASKAKSFLEWQPRTSFEELVSKMVESDLERLSNLIQH